MVHDESVALQPVGSASLSDLVYRQLRDQLMSSRLKPGQRLRIRELAQMLGTSETPVREAVFQLVRDGALELKARHYIRVRSLTMAAYVEIRDIRLLLEPMAAERALLHITPADIEALAKSHETLVAAERSHDWRTAIQANFDFHFGLYRRSELPNLLEILEKLWLRVGPMLNYLYPDGHPTYAGRHQHENVLDALRRKDRVDLAASLRDDMLEGGRNFVRQLERLDREGLLGDGATGEELSLAQL